MNLKQHLDRQAAITRLPSPEQAKAGNYLKGRVKAHGLPVVIENARGSMRRGVGPGGKAWAVKMPAHYGYISRTEGADGDHVDVYLGVHLNSPKIYVLDQNHADTGKFDEHKVFMGFASHRQVLAAYRKAFTDGKADKRFGVLHEMTREQFHDWLQKGDTTKALHRASGGRVAMADGGDPEAEPSGRPRVYITGNPEEGLLPDTPDAGAQTSGLLDTAKGALSAINEPLKRFAQYDRQFTEDVLNLPGKIYDHPESITNAWNNLTGSGGGERYQTWPEKMVRSGASLPHDVMSGDVPQWEADPVTGEMHTSSPMIERAQDTAGMAGGTSFGALDSSAASLGAGPVRRIYRGETANNRGGNFWTEDPEFARQFTQSGREQELLRRGIPEDSVFTPPTPVYAGNEAAVDAAMAAAKDGGFKAVRLSEGHGQPDSIFVFDRGHLKPFPKDVPLPMDEASRMARAAEQGFDGPWYHGSERTDRLTENGKIDPRRATSGPMPFFTDNPEVASNYARGKPDTSLMASDTGHTRDYFTVSPKDLGIGGRRDVPVEQTWNYLPPEKRAEILDKARRVGHADLDMGDGPMTLHPEGVDGVRAGGSFEWSLRENRGNALAALRDIWVDSGRFFDNPSELSEVYRLAGYPLNVSEKNAPWTQAQGVLPARIRMTNPLHTENKDLMVNDVLPKLEQMFARDRTRQRELSATDQWDKNTRYTPKDWIAQAKHDYEHGDNSFVWTSIPDKITNALRSMGYDGMIDTGGKMGGDPGGVALGHRVAIPFAPDQVRSQFAKFDPKNVGKSGLLLSDSAAPGAPLAALEKGSRFYSGLSRAVEAVQQPRMTGEQWLGTLSNKPGVKPEELQYTGLSDFLNARRGQPVTKDEIAQHLDSNAVKLDEVVKGGDAGEIAKAKALAESHGNSWDDLSQVDRNRYMQRANGRRLTESTDATTKYHDYQLPGGENYRETLMTLPERVPQKEFDRIAELAYNKRYDELTKAQQENVERLAGGPSVVNQSNYKSSHWDEPNILAHMRMNDRTMTGTFTPEEAAAVEAHRVAKPQIDAIRAQQGEVAQEISATARPLEQARRAQIIAENKAGRISNGDAMRALEEYHAHPEIVPLQDKLDALRAQESQLRASLPPEPQAKTARSLHLEEIQSDWHQQGRDKGYDTSRIKGEASEQSPGFWRVTWPDGTFSGGLNEESARQLAAQGRKGGVPDAPFKKTWHELALKRALHEAAEKGYDRLSWTPGEAQAARYDLSKQIESLKATPVMDQHGLKYEIRAKGKGGTTEPINTVATEAELPNIVGKEMAQKIVEQTEGKKPVNFSGLDLKVGGEGMKGFYDQIIPKAIEKIGKEYGLKAQKGSLGKPAPEGPFEVRNAGTNAHGEDIFNVYDGTGKMVASDFKSKNAAEDAAITMSYAKPRKSEPVWYVDLPPETRQRMLHKGFSLFEDSAVPGAAIAGQKQRPEAMGFKTRGGTYYEVLKNPNKQDLLGLAKDYPTQGRSAPRMRVMQVGDDVYAWPAAYATHDDIAKSLKLKHPGHENLDVLDVTPRGFVSEKPRPRDWNSLFEDSAFTGAPMSALEHLNDPAHKIRAIRKRGQGIATGKSAKGWEFKRPDPVKGTWDRHVAEVKHGWESDKRGALNEFGDAINPNMKPEDWDFMTSGNFRARGGRTGFASGGAPAFDPDKPFDAAPDFDPDKPFDAAPATPTGEDKGAWNAAGRGAYQGATFNFGDELRGLGEAGGVKPDEWNDPISTVKGAYKYWTGDKGAEQSYDAAVTRERQADKMAAEQHPIAYHGAEIAGSIPSSLMLPGGSVARGATLANRARQGATLGVVAGGLSGAGDGEDAGSRLTGAGIGAVTGGAGGALAAPATDLAGYALKRTLGPAWNAIVTTARGSEREAARRVYTTLQADEVDIAAGKMNGMTIQQWQAAKAAGEPVTLADLGGARTQSLLRSSANTSPEARGTLEKAIGDRFDDQSTRVARDVRSLVNGGANAHKTADQLVAEYDVARAPAYKAAFLHPNASSLWDGDFEQMATAPAVQQAIKMASVNARDEAAKLGLKPPVNPFTFNRDGTVGLTDPNFKPNLQFWDVVKKNLDGGDRLSQQWAKILRNKLDTYDTGYNKARGIAADFFGERDALQAGRTLAGKNVDPQVIAAQLRKMNPQERDLFREGYASDWAGRVIENTRDSRDITKAMFNSPAERKRAEIIFGPQGLQTLQNRMTLETVMDGARKALGNSTTARQLIEAGLAGGAVGGYLEGDWKGAAAGALSGAGARKALGTEMAAGARKLIGKVDAKTAARVADLLTSNDPRKLAQGMRIMNANKKVADGMRAIADRMLNTTQAQAPRPRLNIDTTGWSGGVPARADQEQQQP